MFYNRLRRFRTFAQLTRLYFKPCTPTTLKCKSESKYKEYSWRWAPFTGLLTWLGIRTEEGEKEDPVVTVIKRGILCMRRQQYKESEQLFHVALMMAQERADQQAETYIFDQMANLAYASRDFDKAHQLFTVVISRLMEGGKATETDNSIVEISIKLANMYSQKGEDEKALIGFNHCIKAQEKKIEGVDINEELSELDKDNFLLWAMAVSAYAQHLLDRKKYDQSIENYEKALSVVETINGPNHPQTLVLMNDLANAAAFKKDFRKAHDNIEKAINTAIVQELPQLASFYCNQGMIYNMEERYTEALKACKQAYRIARKEKDNEVVKEAELCLKQAKEGKKSE